jgi:hypothetical protein
MSAKDQAAGGKPADMFLPAVMVSISHLSDP